MLFAWMKSLLFYLLLSGIVIHIVPSNQYKQYIRYFIGLVVIVLLASPLKFLFEFGSGDLQELLAQIEQIEVSEGDMQTGGNIYDYYSLGLREGLTEELKDYHVEDVSILTGTDGTIRQCLVYVSEADYTEEAEMEIKKYISDVYNLDNARIYVISR